MGLEKVGREGREGERMPGAEGPTHMVVVHGEKVEGYGLAEEARNAVCLLKKPCQVLSRLQSPSWGRGEVQCRTTPGKNKEQCCRENTAVGNRNGGRRSAVTVQRRLERGEMNAVLE